MKRVTSKLKPVSGFSHLLHLLLTIIMPIIVFVLVRLSLVQLAIVFVFLSKWRILSVRPRYWLPLVRANAVDLIVGISTIIFMVNTSSGLIQLIWAMAYALWLVLIKPSSSEFGIALQSFIAFLGGLIAVYLEWGGSTAVVIMVMVWLICYSVARHFFTAFDERHSAFLANIWAFFGASVAWVTSFWLLYYQAISQVTLLLIVLGVGLATLYYLSQSDRLSKVLRWQIILIMLAVVIITLAFSDWGNKIV